MTINPFEMQKAMINEWEKNMGEYLDKVLRDPGYLKLVSESMNQMLDFQGMIRSNTQKSLQMLSIPTEDSMKGLYQTVHNLEMRMLDLEEKIADLQKQGKKA